MPESFLSVKEKDTHYSRGRPYPDEITPDVSNSAFPDNEFCLPPDAETKRRESDPEDLQRYRSFVWARFFNSKLGNVKCDFSREASGLYGAGTIERLGLDRKKYVLHSSKAGHLLKAEGFDDKEEFEEAVRHIEQPSEIVWDYDFECYW